MKKIQRCQWVTDDEIYIHYHDKEWGVPIYDDNILFEFLVLESMQAGLNWLTILKKRENFRKAFDDFNVERIAKYNEMKVQALLNDPGIIRNQLKIRATINNATKFIDIQKEQGSFSNYLWAYVDNKPILNYWKYQEEVPTTTELSEQLARDMKKRGFKFLGPTICYAYMQAVGLVNDHTQCFLR